MQNKPKLIGTVKSVLKDGSPHGFIDINSVTHDDGSNPFLFTEHDIFIHSDDCANGVLLEEGMRVAFDGGPDERRGNEYMRAQNVQRVYVNKPYVGKGSLPSFEFLSHEADGISLLRDRHPHTRMKAVPEDTVELVRRNNPLAELAREDQTIVVSDDEEGLRDYFEQYLFTLFGDLATVGVSFSLTDVDEGTQDALVAEIAASYTTLRMSLQAQKLTNMYQTFKKMRQMIVWMWEEKLLRPGTKLDPRILTILIKVVEENPNDKARLVDRLQRIIKLMEENDILSPNSIMPVEYLVDLFLAAPVFYLLLNERDAVSNTTPREYAQLNSAIYRPLRYFCDLIPTQAWRDLFLMFNKGRRGLSEYQGEMLPANLVRIIGSASSVFDHIVMMAPHPNKTGGMLNDPNWVPGVDPYVVGFVEGLPFLFVLGRVSGSSVLALHNELAADTVEFLRNNGRKLIGYNHHTMRGQMTGEVRWYFGPSQTAEEQIRIEMDRTIGGVSYDASHHGDYLIRRVDQLLEALEAGRLFDLLRSTWELPEPDPTP